MDTIQRKFARMGARAAVREFGSRRSRFKIDVARDRFGEYFDLAINRGTHPRLDVVDVDRKDRHLLLMADTSKFLCGHDERHWFVAAIPEKAKASTVATAKEALKPAIVKAAERRAGIKRRERQRRKNRAVIRQGEWFFLSEPNPRRKGLTTLRNVPLIRNAGGKPHVVAEYVRDNRGEVFARGTVRHADHSTIVLDGWHRVVMNTESQAQARRQVMYLD